MFDVRLTFCSDLRPFLRGPFRDTGVVHRRLAEKASVKDVIEACGVPHPEVDLILAQTDHKPQPMAVGFEWQVHEPVALEIFSTAAFAAGPNDVPRLQQRHCARFVADGHLGKLARDLRLLGLDTAYERDADDRHLLEIMLAEDRALLTRDRPLLMHSVVRVGYCPRSPDPAVQCREVLARFGLRETPEEIRPYSRCLRCNGALEAVDKDRVREPLAGEPLTLRYYESFRRCTSCRQIYWPGTHFEKLAARVAQLLGDSPRRIGTD